MNAKDRKLKRLDQLESIAEEITLMLGLKTKVVDDSIEAETILGKINFKPGYNGLMYEVFSFIRYYGLNLASYGLDNTKKLFWNTVKSKHYYMGHCIHLTGNQLKINPRKLQI